jgi:hypothetical protein
MLDFGWLSIGNFSAATVMMPQKSPVAAPPLTLIPKSVRFLRCVDFLDEV